MNTIDVEVEMEEHLHIQRREHLYMLPHTMDQQSMIFVHFNKNDEFFLYHPISALPNLLTRNRNNYRNVVRWCLPLASQT